MDDFYSLLEGEKPKRCEDCGGDLKPVRDGQFVCENCGKEHFNTFGRVRRFIEENGPSSPEELCGKTGADMELIRYYLKKSRLELTDNSLVFLKCEICGANIKSGTICPKCAARKDIAGYYKGGDTGDFPKSSRGRLGTGKRRSTRRHT
ncbi:MAG: hypothetical protein K5985_10505 [Lachnospiraceae bacterium]|nr:hypothetical protein [Lachnospiraceae bacterium]